MKYLFWLTTLLLLSTGLCFTSEAQQLESYIFKEDSLQVGDTLNFSITLNTNKQYESIVFPDSSHFGEGLEIKERKRFKVSQNKDSVSYTLQFFATKDLMLPSMPVHLISGNDTTTLETPQELLAFQSALDGEEFKPLKPIFAFALNYWPYLLALLLLLLLAYLIYRYLKKREEVEEKPIISVPKPVFINPLRELEQTLADLREDRGLTEQRDFKSFYIKLGDAIRLYFERLYKVPALESTTRELIHDLETLYIERDQIQLVKEILREADMVKFAKYTPTLDQAYRVLDKAVRFAENARTEDSVQIERMKEKFEERFNNENISEEVSEEPDYHENNNEKKEEPETAEIQNSEDKREEKL